MKTKLSEIGKKMLDSKYLCPRVPRDDLGEGGESLYQMIEALCLHDVEVEVNGYTYKEVSELIEGIVAYAPEKLGKDFQAIKGGMYHLKALAASCPAWEVGMEPDLKRVEKYAFM